MKKKNQNRKLYSVDLDKLFTAITDATSHLPTKHDEISGLFDMLLWGRKLPGLNLRDMYILYLKYEERLSHEKIGDLIGMTYWTPRIICRKLTKKLRKLVTM